MTLNSTLEWFTAIGTVITAVGALIAAALAFYFGFFGNYQAKLFFKEFENELDIEAFKFLTSIPDEVTSHLDNKTKYGTTEKTIREFISEFHGKVLANIYISKKKLREFHSYINLAEKFAQRIRNTDDFRDKREKLFTELKREAEKLSDKVDLQTRLRGMQKIWTYEEGRIWDKTIFLVEPELPDREHPSFLVYSDFDSDYGCNNAKRVVQKNLNEKYKRTDSFYETEENTTCERFLPTKYELVSRNNESISIILEGEQIKLDYKQPRRYRRSNIA